MARRLILATALALGGALASDAIYAGLVVPRLPGWRSVPYEWWALVFLPCLIAALLAASLLRNWWEILPFAVTLGALWHVYHFGAVLPEFPGTAKSIAREGPLEYWTAFSLVWIALWAIALAVILAIRRWLGESRRTPAAG
jgi:hypothetical protein